MKERISAVEDESSARCHPVQSSGEMNNNILAVVFLLQYFTNLRMSCFYIRLYLRLYWLFRRHWKCPRYHHEVRSVDYKIIIFKSSRRVLSTVISNAMAQSNTPKIDVKYIVRCIRHLYPLGDIKICLLKASHII